MALRLAESLAINDRFVADDALSRYVQWWEACGFTKLAPDGASFCSLRLRGLAPPGRSERNGRGDGTYGA